MREVIVVIAAYGKKTMIVCTNPYSKLPASKRIFKKAGSEDKDTAIVNAMLWLLTMIPKNLDQSVRTRIIMPSVSIKSINPIIKKMICRTMIQNRIIMQTYMSLRFNCPSDRIAQEMLHYMFLELSK